MAIRFAMMQSQFRPNVRCWKHSALTALTAIAALAALTGDATAKKATPVPTVETAPRAADEPIMAIVSIKSQQVTFYDTNGWIVRAPVSTGTKGRETPAGVFAILQKNADHRSNLYGDAKMPHMQRLTWNGIALHGGPLPGYAASHGCVRMPFGFAESMFEKTRMGMRVIVSPDDAAPLEFSHAALFKPDAAAVAAAPMRAETLAREAAEAEKSAVEANKAVVATARAAASANASLLKLERSKAQADAELARAGKALDATKTNQARAQARAEALQLKATAEVAQAGPPLDAAKADMMSKFDAAARAKNVAEAGAIRDVDAVAVARAAASATALLRKLEGLKAKADAELARSEKAHDAAKTDEAMARALETQTKATAAVTQLGPQLDAAKAEAMSKLEAATKAKIAAEADAARKASAVNAARAAASATASLRKLEGLKAKAEAELARADKALDAAKTDQAPARAQDLQLKATAKAAEAGKQLDIAKADAKAKLDAATAAKEAAKAEAIRKADAANAADEAKLAVEPVSVYISRATRKLYVRRNTHKPFVDGGVVYDASIEVPVTIRDPDMPIGTHVFTAMAQNGAGLRWAAVTIDSRDDASHALDRITIPQDVLDRIGPTVLPRSSIIVSDEPPSRETNFRTEFVAVLSDQPQGGFKTRLPTKAPVAVASTVRDGGIGLFGKPKKTGRQRGNKNPDWWW